MADETDKDAEKVLWFESPDALTYIRGWMENNTDPATPLGRHMRALTEENTKLREEVGTLMLAKARDETLERCGICGGAQVEIRPRYPLDLRRFTCPQCTAERLDQIAEIADRNYGIAATEKP